MFVVDPQRRSCACPEPRVSLSGCTSLEQVPPIDPVVASVPPRLEVPPQPVVEPPPAPAPRSHVAIVVSSALPAFMDVAHSLAALLPADDFVVHVLDDESAAAATQQDFDRNGRAPRATVAIGLPAALYARRHIDAPLIFCQVLNYADHPELEQAAAGVSMLAAFDEQLAFWKAIDGSLEVVGTIAGPGHDRLIAQSSAAAQARGIRLESRLSRSDRETVYQFKRLSAEIDGFWLIPDNRVLSLSAIEELMSYAASRRLPVVVSTPELLRFGALMSLAPSPSQVAESIVNVLGSLQQFIAGGFELVSPTGFEVDVNPAVASRLGIGVD